MSFKHLLYLTAGILTGVWLVRWLERGFEEDEHGRPR